MKLSEGKLLKQYQIMELENQYGLKSLGFKQGDILTIEGFLPLDGPMIVKIDYRNYAIARDLATHVQVMEVSYELS